MTQIAEAQDKPQELNEIFSKYVEEALKDFPYLEGKFAILNVDTLEYKGDIDLKKTGFNSQEELNSRLAQEAKISKQFECSMAYHSKKHDLFAICFNGTLQLTGSPERDIMWDLDYTLGQLVMKDKLAGSSENFKECAVDAFSCLKQAQRYGAGNDITGRLAWKRAIHFVLYDHKRHFTSFALQPLGTLLGSIDFEAMTQGQMIDLSLNVAAKFSLPQSIINSTSDAFKVSRSKVAQNKSLEEDLKVYANLICGNVDYHTFKAGLSYIKPYLETRAGFSGKPLDLSGEYWDGVRKTLKEKEFRMESEGLLFNVPQVQPVPAVKTIINFPAIITKPGA